jgi:hypothetical protein
MSSLQKLCKSISERDRALVCKVSVYCLCFSSTRGAVVAHTHTHKSFPLFFMSSVQAGQHSLYSSGVMHVLVGISTHTLVPVAVSIT